MSAAVASQGIPCLFFFHQTLIGAPTRQVLGAARSPGGVSSQGFLLIAMHMQGLSMWGFRGVTGTCAQGPKGPRSRESLRGSPVPHTSSELEPGLKAVVYGLEKEGQSEYRPLPSAEDERGDGRNGTGGDSRAQRGGGGEVRGEGVAWPPGCRMHRGQEEGGQCHIPACGVAGSGQREVWPGLGSRD